MSVIQNLINRLTSQQAQPLPPSPEPKINRLEFYRDYYYKEVDRNTGLTNEITLQGTVMIALISGLFILLTSFKSSSGVATILFNLFVLFDLFCIFRTGYFLLKSYYKFDKGGRESFYLPRIAMLEQHYQNSKDNVNPNEFEESLIDNFCEAFSQLRDNNNDKSNNLNKSSDWMTKSFAAAAFILFCFLVNYTVEPYLEKEEDPLIRVKIEDEPKQQQQSARPGTAKSTAAPTAGETAAPSGRATARKDTARGVPAKN